MQHSLGAFQTTITFDRMKLYGDDKPRPVAHLIIAARTEPVHLDVIEPDIIAALMRAWERHVFNHGPAPMVAMTLQFTSEQDGETSE